MKKLLYCLLCIMFALTSCHEDVEMTYTGRVVDHENHKALVGVMVEITDGITRRAVQQTDDNGSFVLTVEINHLKDCYLLLTNVYGLTKRIELGRYTQKIYDYGDIEFYDSNNPYGIPTFDYGGHKYFVHPDIGRVTWNTMISQIRLINDYGFNDWFVPDSAELMRMYQLKDSIGGFADEKYWSRNYLDGQKSYYVDFGMGEANTAERSSLLHVRPVRYDNYIPSDTLPVVITYGVIEKGSNTIECKGEVIFDGGYDIKERGVCWSSQLSMPTTDDKYIKNGSGIGGFVCEITNLDLNTEYYFRAYAITNKWTAYGNVVSIKTNNGIPQVKTVEIVDVGAYSVTCTGVVVSDNGYDIIDRGFCWSTEPYPIIESAHLSLGKGDGDFVGEIGNLKAGTKYYIRAYAVNEQGEAYGEPLKSTTQKSLPHFAKPTIISIGVKQASVKCSLTDDGGCEILSCGFCWSDTDTLPDLGCPHSIESEASFESMITDLSPDTRYRLRPYATNCIGTVYGEVVAFQTQSGKPSVYTYSATDITAVTAKIEGSVQNISPECPIKSCGFCWSYEGGAPTITDNHVEALLTHGTGKFTNIITGLPPSTNINVCAYVITDLGITYGEAKQFETKKGEPSVSTTNATLQSDLSSILVSGMINDSGGAEIEQCGICWSSTNQNPTINDNVVLVPNQGTGAFSGVVNNLQLGIYYCRAFAQNSYGISYGVAKSVVVISVDF